MISRLACLECHASLEPKTSYVSPVDGGWHYLCANCYALTDAGRVVPPHGFQLFAMAWVGLDGYAGLGSERSSREYIEQELERHRVNGWLHQDVTYEIIEVPGNVDVRWPRRRPSVASATEPVIPILSGDGMTEGWDDRLAQALNPTARVMVELDVDTYSAQCRAGLRLQPVQRGDRRPVRGGARRAQTPSR